MSKEDDPSLSNFKKLPLFKQFDNAFEKATGAARQFYRKASTTGSDLASGGRKVVDGGLDRLQNSLGEDYQEIFNHNPVVKDSLEKSSLLVDNKELLSTAFNLAWSTATLWTAAAGAVATFQHPTARALGGLFHYGPGHVRQWAEINQYMDAVGGSGHRLKYGHSIGYLPDIVQQFGMEGVPAFFCHLLQDFTTVDGLPVLPNAWDVKRHLMLTGIAPKTATALVSLSASNVLAGVMIAASIWKIWSTWERNRQKRGLLAAGEAAAHNRDYPGAIENYKRALELKRDPATLIALGQVYLRRSAMRPYAHHAFTDAVQLLGSDSAKVIPYQRAQLSLRGIAGLQALATADVIGDRYPEYWEERVEDLVHATIHSFSSTAEKLEKESGRAVANSLARPPLFSAAINRYLAAQTACQYPLLEDRHRLVTTHLTAAVGLIGRVAQQNESGLRTSADQLRGVWVRATVPPNEADLLLATS